MDSAQSALAQYKAKDPDGFRKLCADAKMLMQTPVFQRTKARLDKLVGRHELSHAPIAGATAICPIYSALREGAKYYPHLLEIAAELGKGMEQDGAGVEKSVEPYDARTDRSS